MRPPQALTPGPSRTIALLAAVVAVMAAVVASTGTPANAAPASGSGLQVLRTWDAFGATNMLNARLTLDAPNRMAYALSQDVKAGSPLLVRAWNLDTLTPLSAARPESGLAPITPDTPVAVDSRRRTMVLSAVPADAEVANGVAVPTTPPPVLVLGLRAGRLSRLGRPASRFPAGYTIVGLTVDERLDRAFVLAQPYTRALRSVGSAAGGVQLDVWRLADLARGVVGSPLPTPLTVPSSCAQLLSTAFPAALVASPDGQRVYFGCVSSRGVSRLFGAKPVIDVSGVARLDLARAAANDPTSLQIRPVPGDFVSGETFAVPGQRRLALIGASATAGTTARVFDSDAGYYVGNVGLDGQILNGWGTDPRTGRGYYVTDNNIGMLDLAGLPIGQGRVYPELKRVVLGKASSVEVDPVTGRVYTVFVPAFTTKPQVAVLVDLTDGSSAAGPAEPQGLDVAERAGVTESSRLSDLGAVGADYRLVGGPRNLLINAVAPPAGNASRAASRFLQLAAARGVRLSNDQATASAVTASQDDATTADTTSPAGEDASPASPASCADLGAGASAAAVDAASVSCDVAKQRVTAEATAEGARVLLARPAVNQPGRVPAAVQVRSARVSAQALRPFTPGPLTSTVTAEADGIDILGAITIGRVQASLTTSLRGRRGTASAVYRRSVSGLSVAGRQVCSTDCPLDQVQQVVNRALGGRGRIDFPPADRQVRPTGTAADLTDSPARHAERVLFDDVPDDSVLTPAMEVTLYADASTPSRLVVSLAAVSARSRYLIFPAYSDTGGPPGGPTAQRPTWTSTGAGPRLVGGTSPGGLPGTVGAADDERTGAAGLVGLFQRGLAFTLRSWRDAARIASLWLLLALPVYLAARRRLLLSLPLLRPRQEFDR